jgi:hypothetical protein
MQLECKDTVHTILTPRLFIRLYKTLFLYTYTKIKLHTKHQLTRHYAASLA